MEKIDGHGAAYIVGNVNMDILVKHVDRIPDWGTESIVDVYEERLGGCAGNSALVLASLGQEAHVVATVGADHYGDYLERILREEGVRTEGLKRIDDARTGMSFAMIRPDGERLFLTYPGAMFATKYPDTERYLLQGCGGSTMLLTGYFLLSGDIQAERTFKLARAQGMLTLFDTGWPTGQWTPENRNEIMRLLPDVDYFLPNEIEALAITGAPDYKAAAEILSGKCGKGVVIKRGREGAYYLDRSREVEVSGYPVAVSDTVGAGDSFNAGFIYGLHAGWPVERCLELGNAVAAAVISGEGGYRVQWPHVHAIMNKPIRCS